MRDSADREEVVKMVMDTTGFSEGIARQTISLYFDLNRGVIPTGRDRYEGIRSGDRVMAEAASKTASALG